MQESRSPGPSRTGSTAGETEPSLVPAMVCDGASSDGATHTVTTCTGSQGIRYLGSNTLILCRGSLYIR